MVSAAGPLLRPSSIGEAAGEEGEAGRCKLRRTSAQTARRSAIATRRQGSAIPAFSVPVLENILAYGSYNRGTWFYDIVLCRQGELLGEQT